MPFEAPLRSGDPRQVGRYQLTGRIEGIPSDDPIFVGSGQDGTDVAITVLSGEWALDAAARDRFAAEAAVAKRVPPFSAARVLDAGLDGSLAYLVSEYIRGQSLLELVSAEGVMRGHDLEAVAIGMATGLASVHQAGLVHGSFGPEYVILASDGAPRVVEYGITPPYGAATPSADMLAWAQTVVFAASGHPPATFDDLDGLPDGLKDAVGRCLDPEPAERPAARAIVQGLLGSQPLRAGVLAEGSRRGVRAGRGAYDSYRDVAGQGDDTDVTAGRAHAPDGGGYAAGRAAGRSGHGGTGGRRSPARHGPAGRRTGLLIAASIVAVLVVGAVVLRLVLAGGGHNSASKLSADTGRTTTSASPSASPTPSEGPVIPLQFDGTWTGVVTQPPTDTYNVTVTLAAGKTAGEISYSATGFTCSGTLTLTADAAHKLVATQGITQGKCENGQATIMLTSANRIWFSFHSNGPIASGTLARH